MSISLYHATVPTFLQVLNAVSGLIDKAEAFCAEQGIEPSALIEARLAPDMRPFSYQILTVASHSFGAVEGVRKGAFSPDESTPPSDFAGLRACVAEAIRGLDGVGYGELDAYIGKQVMFSVRAIRMPFLAEEFLLSFSQPNFHFHATTAYDILRWKGLPIGKRDYLGQMRMANLDG